MTAEKLEGLQEAIKIMQIFNKSVIKLANLYESAEDLEEGWGLYSQYLDEIFGQKKEELEARK